jgi:Ca2+-binding EF-hand superfamily protein
LYLETLALKVQLNSTNDEVSKLKCKVTQLKKDLGKTQEAVAELSTRGKSGTTQLVLKLKHVVNGLKEEFDAQKGEIQGLKKKMRVTQYVELEAEKQVYVSECTRLRRQLEDTMRGGSKENLAGFEAMKAENEVLKKELSLYKRPAPPMKARLWNAIEETSPKKAEVVKRPPSVQDQLEQTQRQFQDTKETLELERRSRQDLTRSRDRSSIIERPSLSATPETLTNSFIQKLHKELKRVRKDLETVMCAFSSHDYLTPTDFYEQLHFSGLAISEPEVKEMWRTLFKEPKVSLHLILTALGRDSSVFDLPSPFLDSISRERLSDFSDNSIALKSADRPNEEVPDKILQHLALRLQLHRISSEQAVQLMSKVINASPMTQQAMLADEPFELKTEVERSKALKALRGCLSLHELAEQLGTWQVLEDSEEERFDAQLAEMMRPVKERLLTTCELYDVGQSGNISLEKFFEATQSCGMTFDPRLKTYIRLLSYSFEHVLDHAPYVSLVDAFAKDVEEESSVLADISEQEQEKIVTRVLKEVVRAVKKLGVSLNSVFETTNGLITPNGLLEGLNALLMENVNKREFLVLLATLQSDNYEDPVVEFNDLEAFVREVAESFAGELQQPEKLISLLDSPEELEQEEEEEDDSYVVVVENDPVKMSSRALMETEALSFDSGPQSY